MTALNDFYLPLVCREHGHNVVRYSLGLEDSDSLESIQWTRERMSVLQLLLGGVSVADLRHENQQKQYKNAIYGYNRNTEDSILRSARKACGGNTSDIDAGTENDDQIVKLLQQLTNRYELDIQMSLNPGFGIPIRLGAYGDGVSQQLIGSILQDARFRPLGRVFELQDNLAPQMSMPTCRRTSGHSSGSLLLDMIPDGLMHACATRVLIRGEPLSCSNMRNEAKGVVSDFASLVAGQRVALPAAVGAVGSQMVREDRSDCHRSPSSAHRPIAATDRVEAGDGYLRPTVKSDESLFQMAIDRIGVVWVTTRDTRILLQSLNEPDDSGENEVGHAMKQLRQGIVPLQEKWAHVAQAIALSSQEDPPPGLAMSEVFVSGVLEPWGEQSSARLTAQGESAWRQMTPSAMGDIKFWQGRLAEAPLALDVSRRRLVSALAERNSVTDSLVDAVVAWEAIFSGAPETQMRTVVPSCRLLAEGSDRATLLHEMKQVYGLRSQVVHGKASKKVSDADIGIARDKAIRWVIELLRVLFAERPNLLDLSASQRSDAVLLEP